MAEALTRTIERGLRVAHGRVSRTAQLAEVRDTVAPCSANQWLLQVNSLLLSPACHMRRGTAGRLNSDPGCLTRGPRANYLAGSQSNPLTAMPMSTGGWQPGLAAGMPTILRFIVHERRATSTLRRVRPWLRKPTTQAGGLVLLGFLATAIIALLGNGTQWPVLLLLTLLAGIFQYAGASKFHDTGKADPSLARASTRRLLGLATRARASKELAERAYEGGGAAESKRLMGRLSAELSYIEEGAVQAIEDWREFHREALKEIDGKNADE